MAGVRCSFCEQPLLCKACNRPFVPRDLDTHRALYQPEYLVVCPDCHEPTRIRHTTLDDGKRIRVCQHCGKPIEAAS